MKRKIFLYAGLLLMGIMGALSSGVARAETVVKHHTGSNIGYRLNNNTKHFTGVGTITVTDGIDTITILDRNLGATAAGIGCKGGPSGICGEQIDETYGYHFQWGNNRGFEQCTESAYCTTFPGGEVAVNGQVSGSLVTSGYSSGVFYYFYITSRANFWIDDDIKIDMWGGSIDDNTYNLDDGTRKVTNAEERQGPCPEGFHVPSIGELKKLGSLMGDDPNQIQDKLLIPLAGSRNGTNAGAWRRGNIVFIQSSSLSGHMYFYGGENGISKFNYTRNMGGGDIVRCMYNYYKAYPITLSFMNDDVEMVSGSMQPDSLRTGDIPTPTKDGHSFQYRYLSGHENTPFDFENTLITEDTTLYAKWIKVVTVSFDVNGGNETIAPITGNYNEPITAPTEPTRASHRFLHRYLSGDNANNAFDFSTPITGDITLVAEWKKRSSSTSTTSSSSETNTGSTTNTGDNNTNTGSTNTGTVNTGTNNDKINTGSNNTGMVEDDNGFTQEFIDAYNFAKENGITTMPTIDQANMTGNLTRIQMAKMLSYYAINIMGKKPDETRNNKFNDVSEKLNSDYNNGVILAYQLGIMGINMPNNNFRPNDLVTRGEFVTALSRMIYGTEDGEYENTSKYYTKHIEKLNEEEIIKQIDPSMKELRAYVMIMLKRISEK